MAKSVKRDQLEDYAAVPELPSFMLRARYVLDSGDGLVRGYVDLRHEHWVWVLYRSNRHANDVA